MSGEITLISLRGMSLAVLGGEQSVEGGGSAGGCWTCGRRDTEDEGGGAGHWYSCLLCDGVGEVGRHMSKAQRGLRQHCGRGSGIKDATL